MSEPAARPTPDFDAALRDARAGGEAGLTVLFRAYQPRLLRYLRAREPRHADDVVGETWVAVASRVARFEGGEAAFAAWIFTIARQRMADVRRTGARRRTDPVAEPPDSNVTSPTEEVAIDGLDAQGAADLVVRLLPPDQAEVVLLRTMAGLGVADVAAVMGRDENWVRVTHHRALRRLRERMSRRSL